MNHHNYFAPQDQNYLDKNNHEQECQKQVFNSDSVKLKETAQVIRYKGTKDINEMISNEQYIEAFTHTQLGIEKILWDKIVRIFEDEKAKMVRRTINAHKKSDDRSNTTTAELIKWAHFLGAIDDNEYSDLKDFNKKRNEIIHGHGRWWHFEEYIEALRKAIRFLERNGL